MMKFVQILTTVDTKKTATKIVTKLVGHRLTSCVQVLGPIESTYRWNGKIEHAKEWLCLVKARASDYRRIEVAIGKMHPYKVPEILAFPVQYGNRDYLNWIKSETSRKSAKTAL